MKNELLKTYISSTSERNTSFPCSKCKTGRLHFNWDALIEKESSNSRIYHECNQNCWSLFEYDGVFSVSLTCNNSECCEPVICSGKSFYDAEYEVNEQGETESNFVLALRPQFFTPPLKYITIPDDCPKVVKDNLIEAFYLTPLSLSSAVNRTRISIENLLNSFKIPKSKIIKGHRKKLTLHERIKVGSSKVKVLDRLEEAITALKWIGNEGSHSDSKFTIENIEYVYKLIEYVLNSIYKPENDLIKIAKKINKHKGITKMLDIRK